MLRVNRHLVSWNFDRLLEVAILGVASDHLPLLFHRSSQFRFVLQLERNNQQVAFAFERHGQACTSLIIEVA